MFAFGEGAKPGCNIKALTVSRLPRRLVSDSAKRTALRMAGGDQNATVVNMTALFVEQEISIAVENIPFQENIIDLSDFDYEKCLQSHIDVGVATDSTKVQVDIQVAVKGPSYAFEIDKDPKNSKALKGKRLEGTRGQQRIGEFNLVMGERGDIAG